MHGSQPLTRALLVLKAAELQVSSIDGKFAGQIPRSSSRLPKSNQLAPATVAEHLLEALRVLAMSSAEVVAAAGAPVPALGGAALELVTARDAWIRSSTFAPCNRLMILTDRLQSLAPR